MQSPVQLKYFQSWYHNTTLIKWLHALIGQPSGQTAIQFYKGYDWLNMFMSSLIWKG